MFWEMKEKGSPFAGFALKGKIAIVRFHKLITHIKPKAGSFANSFCGEEWGKKLVFNFIRDRLAII